MIVIGDINLGKLFISFYYFLGKQAQKSNILCLINAAENYTSLLFFFTPEEINGFSILGGGGGGGGCHEIIFDTSDGAMRFFGGNTMVHEKKQRFWRKDSGPG